MSSGPFHSDEILEGLLNFQSSSEYLTKTLIDNIKKESDREK
jgi:hypothetical protein